METQFLLTDFSTRLSVPDRSRDSGPLGEGNQFRERLDLHLLHHPVAMGLDRALGRTQYVADLLVGLAANDEFEDFAFARRHFAICARTASSLSLWLRAA